jgi:thioredoxin 1
LRVTARSARIRRKHSEHYCGKGKAMIEITERNFDKEVLECKLPVFACFTTLTCHNCYPTCLIADQLAKEYDESVKFVKLNSEKSLGIAEKYHVIAVPTILIFKNAKEVNRLLGFQDISTLKSLLDNVTSG